MSPKPTRLLTFALAMAACACSLHMPFSHARAVTPEQRRHVPKSGHLPRFAPPPPTQFVLDNDLSVYVLKKDKLPLVSAALVVRGGSASDGNGQEGISALMAESAKLGTQKRSAQQIAEHMEDLGASLEVATATESVMLYTEALTDTLPHALDVLSDVALHPTFAAAEVKRAQQAHLGTLALSDSEPSTIARRISRQVVFEGHPYSHLSVGAPSSVAALTPKQLAAHHRRTFAPGQAALILVGDIDVPQAKHLAETYFGAWRAAPGPALPAVAPPEPHDPHLVLVDRPNAPQAECIVAGLGVSRDAPEYPSLVLGNAILGGMFNSRINMNLREAKGWTYGARSAFSALRNRGLFSIGSALRTDVAAEGVGEMFAELDKMLSTPVSAEELSAAKNRHVLSVAGSMETVGQLAAQVADLFVYELPLDYWQRFPERLHKVDETDVLTSMRGALQPSRLSVVVVGDRSKLEDKLEALQHGSLEMRSVAGTPIAARKTAKISSKVNLSKDDESGGRDVSGGIKEIDVLEENGDDDEDAAATDERDVNVPPASGRADPQATP